MSQHSDETQPRIIWKPRMAVGSPDGLNPVLRARLARQNHQEEQNLRGDQPQQIKRITGPRVGGPFIFQGDSERPRRTKREISSPKSSKKKKLEESPQPSQPEAESSGDLSEGSENLPLAEIRQAPSQQQQPPSLVDKYGLLFKNQATI